MEPTKPKTGTIEARQENEKTRLIEALRKSPIVQAACQQAGVGRATYYRWRNDDETFAKSCDDALDEGVSLVNDLAESRLITSIKEQNFHSISFWLRHRHAAYAEKLQVNARIDHTEQPLTQEQEDAIRRAIELAHSHKTYDHTQHLSSNEGES